eukprot:6971581-Prorocentrum_lima.AAC.1
MRETERLGAAADTSEAPRTGNVEKPEKPEKSEKSETPEKREKREEEKVLPSRPRRGQKRPSYIEIESDDEMEEAVDDL